MTHRTIKRIILHCTATSPYASVEAIRKIHIKKRWDDIGYHYIVDRNGTVHKGREENVKGAHVTRHNDDSIGIAYIGGIDYKKCPVHGDDKKKGEKCSCSPENPEDTRTCAQKEAIFEIVRKIREKHRTCCGPITVHGHNEYNKGKACPSFDVISPISVSSVSWVDAKQMPSKTASILEILGKSIVLREVPGGVPLKIEITEDAVDVMVCGMQRRGLWRYNLPGKIGKEDRIEDGQPWSDGGILKDREMVVKSVKDALALWPDLAVFGLRLTANKEPPRKLRWSGYEPDGGEYEDNKNPTHYRQYRAMASYEFWPGERRQPLRPKPYRLGRLDSPRRRSDIASGKQVREISGASERLSARREERPFRCGVWRIPSAFVS